jgi:hypothetical protein
MKAKPRTSEQVFIIGLTIQFCEQRRLMFENAKMQLAAVLPELSEQDVSDIANGVVLFDVNSIEVLEGDEER